MAEQYDFGVPTVRPDGPPANDYQRIDATPGAFGALQARALQATGAELGQASDQTAQTAQLIQQRYNQVSVDQGVNSFMDKVQKQVWGDPQNGVPGIYNLHGQAAMDAAPKVQQTLDSMAAEQRAAFTNDAQRLQFDQVSRYMLLREKDRIGSHVDSESTKWATATNQATMDLAGRSAALDAGNLDNSVLSSYLAAGKQADLISGGDPTVKLDYMQKAAGSAVYQAVDALAARDPAAAQRMIESGTIPGMKPGERLPISGVLTANHSMDVLKEKIENLAASRYGGEAGAAAFYRVTGQSTTRSSPIDNATADRAKQVYDGLVKRGMDSNTALGFAASAVGESAVKPDNIGDGGAAGTTRGAHGLFMWRNSGNDHRLDDYVTQHGHLPEQGNVDEQLDHIVWELRGREASARQSISATPNTPADRARAVSQFFERPQDVNLNASTRAGYAQQLASRWGLAAPGTPPLPTTNDAKPPLTGDQILAGQAYIDADPRVVGEKARNAAHIEYQHYIANYNQALRADAENALNGLTDRILTNPYGVTLNDITQTTALTAPEKMTMAHALTAFQSGKAQGDGERFGETIDRIQAQPGTDGRLNTPRDLIPLLNNGLTYAGLQKAEKFIKDRDSADGPALKAAMAAWQDHILSGGTGRLPGINPPPVAKLKWAEFLSAAQPVIDQARGKMTMGEIIGPNGPVAKMLPAFTMSAAERLQSLVSTTVPPPAPPAEQPGILSRLYHAVTDPSAAPGLAAGQFYVPDGAGGFRQVAPNTPHARRYTGGAIGPGSFEAPQEIPQAPQAPH